MQKSYVYIITNPDVLDDTFRVISRVLQKQVKATRNLALLSLAMLGYIYVSTGEYHKQIELLKRCLKKEAQAEGE